MNCSTFTLAVAVAIIFFICKFMEVQLFAKMNKMTDDDESDEDETTNANAKPFKDILRNTALVFSSVWIASFILSQFENQLGLKGGAKAPPMVFTDPPNF